MCHTESLDLKLFGFDSLAFDILAGTCVLQLGLYFFLYYSSVFFLVSAAHKLSLKLCVQEQAKENFS